MKCKIRSMNRNRNKKRIYWKWMTFVVWLFCHSVHLSPVLCFNSKFSFACYKNILGASTLRSQWVHSMYKSEIEVQIEETISLSLPEYSIEHFCVSVSSSEMLCAMYIIIYTKKSKKQNNYQLQIQNSMTSLSTFHIIYANDIINLF